MGRVFVRSNLKGPLRLNKKVNTFGEFITGLTNADVEDDFFDSDFSHGVLFFDFGGHGCFMNYIFY